MFFLLAILLVARISDSSLKGKIKLGTKAGAFSFCLRGSRGHLIHSSPNAALGFSVLVQRQNSGGKLEPLPFLLAFPKNLSQPTHPRVRLLSAKGMHCKAAQICCLLPLGGAISWEGRLSTGCTGFCWEGAIFVFASASDLFTPPDTGWHCIQH